MDYLKPFCVLNRKIIDYKQLNNENSKENCFS